MLSSSELYRKQLLTPEWDQKRREIYKRDKYICQDCGEAGVTVHCHHEYYVKGKRAWEYPAHAYVTVCKSCHDERHKDFRKEAHATQEDANEWMKFTGAYKKILRDHLRNRSNRIKALEDKHAEWDAENQWYGYVDQNGVSRFFDADGEPM